MTDDILSYNLRIKILPDQGSAKEISITYELSFWSYSGHIFFKKTLKYPIIGLTCLFSFKIEEMRISQNIWLDQTSAILLSLNLCKNSWKINVPFLRQDCLQAGKKTNGWTHKEETIGLQFSKGSKFVILFQWFKSWNYLALIMLACLWIFPKNEVLDIHTPHPFLIHPCRNSRSQMFLKYVLLKISQISQKNNCAGVFI